MSFYRKNRNKENYRGQSISEDKKERFQISNKSFQSATIISSFIITCFVFILFIIKVNFSVSESDIQTISGITAGLCSFALAIPLFLKDFNTTSNFWKQFYLIAITFLVASFLGVMSFLLIDDILSINIMLHLWFFLSVIISVNIGNISILFNKTFKLSINPILNLFIGYLTLFISLSFSKGFFLIYATTLFSIYGFYLTLTLMLSILMELFFSNSEIEDNDARIKKSIQHLVEKYNNKAFTEQMLLDKLKYEEFPNEQEIISRTKIQDLVAEMDSESEKNKPKISIYDDKIISRWTKKYDEIVDKTNLIIWGRCVSTSSYYMANDLLKPQKADIDKIYGILSTKTRLSKELLIENNCISKYCLFYGEITDNYDKNFIFSFIVKSNEHMDKGSTVNLKEFDGYDISFLDEKNNPLKIISDYSISVYFKEILNEV